VELVHQLGQGVAVFLQQRSDHLRLQLLQDVAVQMLKVTPSMNVCNWVRRFFV
jgi:hypothetical protein